MRFQCSHCDHIVSVNNDDLGSMITCGHCNKVDNVPEEKFGPRVVINDFVIIREIGLGRMAKVYLAHQMSLDRKVALKILSLELADDSDFIMDFFREARAASRLNHPNIVQAYAVDEEDGTYFLAMEHIEGRNLKQMIEEEGQLPFDYALRLLHQIAEALSFIWKGHKISHENIKPENILITHADAAKLSDLGLSMTHRRREISTKYLSPEKILGSKIDIRSDIYSLGITFYEMLAGVPPFDSESSSELRNLQLKQTPPNIRKLRSNVPDSYIRILDKCLAKHPDDRYQSPDQLINDIKLARASKAEKKSQKSARRAKMRGDLEGKQSYKIRKINTVLIISLLINAFLLLIILMKAPATSKDDNKIIPNEIIKYHQLATDMNTDTLSPEKSAPLLEEVNLFIRQYPESPHIRVVKYWKIVLEEITIRSKRLELHEDQIRKNEDNEVINAINGKNKIRKK